MKVVKSITESTTLTCDGTELAVLLRTARPDLGVGDSVAVSFIEGGSKLSITWESARTSVLPDGAPLTTEPAPAEPAPPARAPKPSVTEALAKVGRERDGLNRQVTTLRHALRMLNTWGREANARLNHTQYPMPSAFTAEFPEAVSKGGNGTQPGLVQFGGNPEMNPVFKHVQRVLAETHSDPVETPAISAIDYATVHSLLVNAMMKSNAPDTSGDAGACIYALVNAGYLVVPDLPKTKVEPG